MVLMEKDLYFEVPYKLQKLEEANKYREKIEEIQNTELDQLENELT